MGENLGWWKGNGSGIGEEMEKKAMVKSNVVWGKAARVWGKRAFENGVGTCFLGLGVPKQTFWAA